jgi:hypothetical protein
LLGITAGVRLLLGITAGVRLLLGITNGASTSRWGGLGYFRTPDPSDPSEMKDRSERADC